MITVTTVVVLVLVVIGLILYRQHTTLKPMSELEVRELHQKFHAAFKDVYPKPLINFQLNKQHQPTYLYLTQGKHDFLMLAWNNKKTPDIKKYSRDSVNHYATHRFLEHLNVKPPQ